MFSGWHQAEEIDDVDEAYLQIGEVFLENRDGRQCLHGCDIAGTSHHHVGFLAIIRGGPVPNTNALRAVRYGILHAEVLQVVLLVRNNYVDVIP